LPGALQSQGYGDEISVNTPWVLTLYDRNWFLRADYQAYTNAGHVKVPFVCQPPRHYLGAAWYQRDVEIPKDWQDRRVVLFLERPRWESRVWLDDQFIGTNISLCTPHEYELGMSLKPGKHRLTVRVDNRMIMAYRPDAHSVSDSLDSSWNGIIGKMELRSTPPVWLEDVRVFPDASAKAVTVRVKIGNATGRAGQGTAWISMGLAFTSKERREFIGRFAPLTNVPVKWSESSGSLELVVPVTCVKDPQLWSEFNPELYAVSISLSTNSFFLLGDSSARVTFGLRDIRA